MYCRHCGTKLLDNDKFCGKCGTKIAIEKIVYEEEKPMESKISNTAAVAITICILVLSLTIIICTSLIANTNEENRLIGLNNIVDIM